MLRALLGLLLGAALSVGASYLFLRRNDSCLDRCGTGTVCAAGKCIVAPAVEAGDDEGDGPGKKRKRRRPAGSTSTAADSGGRAAPEATLKPGDEKMVTKGDALGRPQKLDFGSGGDEREVSEADLDNAWRSAQPRVLDCIAEARGELPLDRGKVVVGLHIEASGTVDRVRVEAPAVLQAHGLYACVRRVAMSTRFPRGGTSNVVTFPFELR